MKRTYTTGCRGSAPFRPATAARWPRRRPAAAARRRPAAAAGKSEAENDSQAKPMERH